MSKKQLHLQPASGEEQVMIHIDNLSAASQYAEQLRRIRRMISMMDNAEIHGAVEVRIAIYHTTSTRSEPQRTEFEIAGIEGYRILRDKETEIIGTLSRLGVRADAA